MEFTFLMMYLTVILPCRFNSERVSCFAQASVHSIYSVKLYDMHFTYMYETAYLKTKPLTPMSYSENDDI